MSAEQVSISDANSNKGGTPNLREYFSVQQILFKVP
jgi:hypothetical protein